MDDVLGVCIDIFTHDGLLLFFARRQNTAMREDAC